MPRQTTILSGSEPMGARGAMLAAACGAVHGLEARGLLARDALLERLPEEDLSYLYTAVQPDRWYPIDTVDRLCRLVRDVAQPEGTEILVERGRMLAGELLERPIVQELAEARPQADGPAPWWSRKGHLLVAVPSSLFTHTRWVLHPDDDPGRFVLEVTDAADFPDAARLGVQGALEEIARTVAGRRVLVRSERPEASRIVYHGRPASEHTAPRGRAALPN